ncbi:MAG: hypothetical protein HY851_04030, partial [candidate division Zixibacteria bacterium]|nr:hypothetical protein [candidate division Zixibacteria bacterium]
MVKNAGANQISISSESTSPTEARDIANILGELFVAELLRQEVASVRSSQDFTDVQLEKYEKLLQDKIDEKTSFERRLLQNRLDTAVVSESNRNQIQSEVDQTEEDITDYQNEEKSLLARLNSKSPRLPTAGLTLRDSKQNQQNKEALKNQLQTMNDLLQRYAWSDAQAMNYRLKQSSLLSQIESENKKLVAEQFAQSDDDTRNTLARLFTVRVNAEFLETKMRYLKSTLDAIRDRISRIPEYQATMDRLNRDIFNATELRDKFKKQQEGSTISQALLANMSTSKYRIVEPAALPLVPVRPDRVKVYLLGVVLGLAIGIAVIVLAEVFDSSFKKLQDVEDTLGLPVLGLVPKMQFVAYLKKQIK